MNGVIMRVIEESAVLDNGKFSSVCWTGVPASIRGELAFELRSED